MDALAKAQARLARLGVPVKAAASPSVRRSSGFAAAEYSRINASLVSEARHINDIIRWQGHTLLARSRQQAHNNEYVIKFLQMVVNNVCGPVPFQLQGRITNRAGKPDKAANETLETSWKRWSRPGVCDFYGRLSLADMYRLAARVIARDGECFIRIHEGVDAGTFGIQLQMIDTDRIPFLLNKQLANGNVIHAGVEVDPRGRTVAYHVLKRRPIQWQYNTSYTGETERVPAEQMFHLFIPLDPEQIRGIPWIYGVLVKLHQIGAFEEAAVIAARVGAAKMGFFERKPEEPDDEYEGDEEDEDGARITDAEPGTFEEIPAGLTFKSWDPNYPSDQVGPFLKALLRGVAAGFCVSYHSLGNDLESVNLSSARAGILEERDFWMILQNWLSEHFPQELQARWVPMAFLTGQLAVTGPLEKYTAVYFQARRWSWIDPLKDVNANVEAIKWGLKSRTAIIAEQGSDREDVFLQLESEMKDAKAKGIDVAPIKETGGTANAIQDDNSAE